MKIGYVSSVFFLLAFLNFHTSEGFAAELSASADAAAEALKAEYLNKAEGYLAPGVVSSKNDKPKASSFSARDQMSRRREALMEVRSQIAASQSTKPKGSEAFSAVSEPLIQPANHTGGDRRFESSYLNFPSSSYVNNMSYQWIGSFYAPAGATSTAVHFSSGDLESGYDYVYVVNEFGVQCDRLTGYFGGRTAVACDGDYAEIRVSTDSSVNGATHSGFTIDGFYYTPQFTNSYPVAFGTANYYSSPEGYGILFSGNQSYDPDSGDSIRTYEWDFGDGTYSSSQNVYHTYASSGTFRVYLTVSDQHGAEDYDTFLVTARKTETPENFVVIDSTGRSINLDWTSGGSDTDGFFINHTQGFSSSLRCDFGTNIGSSTSYRITGLNPTTNYTIKVCAYNDYNRLSDAVTLFVTTPAITFPPAPINLALTSVGAHRLTVGWATGGGNTVDYRVAIAAGSVAPACSGGSVTTSRSATFTGLVSETLHTISVCARNSDGDIGSRATIFATTNPIAYPPAPTDLVVSDLRANRAVISFESTGGNTAEFFASILPGSVPPTSCSTRIGGATTRTASFSSLVQLTTYSVSICAANDENDRTLSSMTFTTPPTPPAPPSVTGLEAFNIGVNTISLRWVSGGGSTFGYRLTRQVGTTAPSCVSGGTVVALDATTQVISGLDQNKTYSFSVCPFNNVDAYGTRTSIMAATLNPAPPPNVSSLAVTARTDSSISLSWVSGGSNTASFRVMSRAGSTSAPTNCVGGVDTSSTQITIDGLSPFTNHGFRVCSVNAIGAVSGGSTKSDKTLDHPPLEVDNFRVSSQTYNSMMLSWDYIGTNVAGSFIVKRATGLTAPSNCASGSTVAFTARGFSATSLASNTDYSFRICSKNGNNVQTVGVVTTGRTNPANPPNPSSLAAVAISSGEFSLTWRSGGGTTAGYIVSHRTGTIAPVNCSVGVATNSTALSLSGLSPFADYSIRVCAVNSVGVASSGVTITRRTLDLAPSEVADLIVSGLSPSTVSLSWTRPGTSRGGKFIVARASGLIPPASCSGGSSVLLTARAFMATGLSANRDYSFRVCEENGNQIRTAGVTLTTRTFQSAPPNPNTLSATNVTSTSMDFNWRSGGGNTAHFLVSYQSGSSYPASGCPGGTKVEGVTTYAVAGLTPNTLYRYRICAVNAQGVVSTGAASYKRTLPSILP